MGRWTNDKRIKVQALQVLEERAQEYRDRVARQRNLFTFLPVVPATEMLKQAMLQRAYDLMWEGSAEQADAILEFIPSKDAHEMLDAWERDYEGREAKSKWHEEE